MSIEIEEKQDIVLIGAGIMSATLAQLLSKKREEGAPIGEITIIEAADRVAGGASAVLNNAGTGHAANCEPNYGGGEKAIAIHESFAQSLEFWENLMFEGVVSKDAIHQVDHSMLGFGEKGEAFVRAYMEKLQQSDHFKGKYDIGSEMPPLLSGVKGLIATRNDRMTTDVNFEMITRGLMNYLESSKAVTLNLRTRVRNINSDSNGIQILTDKGAVLANKVFVGAGGEAVPLFKKAADGEPKSPEAIFPIDGHFLLCFESSVVEKHDAKVYSPALEGAPPMSAPHLDKRWMTLQQLEKSLESDKSLFKKFEAARDTGKLNIKKGEDHEEMVEVLMFGPFASMSFALNKGKNVPNVFEFYLKNPSLIPTVLKSLYKNSKMVQYLVGESIKLKTNPKAVFETLKRFYPEADIGEWDLVQAGKRVQIIDPSGDLVLGTKVLSNEKGDIAALGGASPGASMSYDVMKKIADGWFPEA